MEDRVSNGRRRHVDVVVTVTWDQLDSAAEQPNRGLPAYEITRFLGNPADRVWEPIFAKKNYRVASPEHGRVNGAPL